MGRSTSQTPSRFRASGIRSVVRLQIVEVGGNVMGRGELEMADRLRRRSLHKR